MSVLRKLAMKITGSSTETADQHYCEFGTPSHPCGAPAATTVRVGRTKTDGESKTDVTFDVCDRHYPLLQKSTTFEIKEKRDLTVSARLSKWEKDQVLDEYREDTKDLPPRVDIREMYRELVDDWLQRLNQKVEEEGKSPEKAMEEIYTEDMTSQERTTEGTSFGRIAQNDDGTIDEIGGDCQFHLEDLGETYYLGIYPDGGEERRFHITVEDGEPVVVPYDEYYEDEDQ